MACGPVCSHAGSPAPVLLPSDNTIAAASAMGFVLEISCRAELAQTGRRASLAARFLGYPVEAGGELRRKVAVCGRKSRAGRLGGECGGLAISRRAEFAGLVNWRALLRRRRGFVRATRPWPCESGTTRRASLHGGSGSCLEIISQVFKTPLVFFN